MYLKGGINKYLSYENGIYIELCNNTFYYLSNTKMNIWVMKMGFMYIGLCKNTFYYLSNTKMNIWVMKMGFTLGCAIIHFTTSQIQKLIYELWKWDFILVD